MEGDESEMILSFGWTADYLPSKGCKDTTLLDSFQIEILEQIIKNGRF
jgi:hypothetical protein